MKESRFVKSEGNMVYYCTLTHAKHRIWPFTEIKKHLFQLAMVACE